jgi:hypothetical protein
VDIEANREGLAGPQLDFSFVLFDFAFGITVCVH